MIAPATPALSPDSARDLAASEYQMFRVREELTGLLKLFLAVPHPAARKATSRTLAMLRRLEQLEDDLRPVCREAAEVVRQMDPPPF